MIYAPSGEPVILKGISWDGTEAFVRAASSGECFIKIAELRADGGAEEIDGAIADIRNG